MKNNNNMALHMVDWKGRPVDKQKHGGIRASLFIYFLDVMFNAAYVPNMLNVVSYLHSTMHTGVAASSTIATNWFGAMSAFALLGAFVSDSYFLRWQTILIFTPFQLLGFGLLALQAHLPSLRPPECDTVRWVGCEEVSGVGSAALYAGLYAVALGAGILNAALAPHGSDQFDGGDPAEAKLKISFFNWFTFGLSVGGFTGLVLIVWVENNKGFALGFAICALVLLLGLLVFASGLPFYRNHKPTGSPLTRVLQVIVAAFRNRKLQLPEKASGFQELEDKEGHAPPVEELTHTKGLRFLDKACLHAGARGGAKGGEGAWWCCSVSQVEETKIILRMIPIILSSVLCYIPNLLILTFSVQQGGTMDTRVGAIRVSPASLMVIPVTFQMLALVAYDRIFVPFARRLTGHPGGISTLQRSGTGFLAVLSAAVVAAIVERRRLAVAEEHGLQEYGAGVPMSVMWLGIQFFVIGITDVTAWVGLLEFFNSEAPAGMKSVGTAIFFCVTGISSFLGSVAVKAVNRATGGGRGGAGKGWLDGANLNESHLDRFYWLLAAWELLAILNFLYWARRYKYRATTTSTAS